jgi:hypothetical protein
MRETWNSLFPHNSEGSDSLRQRISGIQLEVHFYNSLPMNTGVYTFIKKTGED